MGPEGVRRSSAGRPHGQDVTPHTAILGAERHFEGAAPSSSTTIDTMPTGAVCGSSYVPIRGGGILVDVFSVVSLITWCSGTQQSKRALMYRLRPERTRTQFWCFGAWFYIGAKGVPGKE